VGGDPSDYTDYEYWVRKLYMTNLFNAAKMGLENTVQLHAALGSPMDNPNLTIIHVAGTNGKGSVCYKIARALTSAGNKTGLFVSPHVSSFRERCQVDGVCMSEEEVVRLLPLVYDACESGDIPATFFEITTALAFLFFEEKGCNAVVLETGLGGRLDATNVVSKPAVSVITSIGMEHTRILGDTIEEIAMEKAGIVKKGRPVLMGPCVPHGIIRKHAEFVGAGKVFTVDDVLGSDDDGPGIVQNLPGKQLATAVDFDYENSRIACAALQIVAEEGRRQLDGHAPHLLPISDGDVCYGMSVRPPCRFEMLDVWSPVANVNVTVVLDIAHNPPALAQLFTKLSTTFPGRKLRVVIGMSSDKDISASASIVLSCVSSKNVHLIQAAHPRAATLEQIKAAAPAFVRTASNGCHGNGYDCDDNPSSRNISFQVGEALEMASQRDEVLVVCGSVFIMSEAREALGFNEPRDTKCIAEVAGSGLRHSQEQFGDIGITLADSKNENIKVNGGISVLPRL